MSKKAIVALAGPWAILMHIGLARVRGWTQTAFFGHGWLRATGVAALAFVVIAGLSLVLFRGSPRHWPWGKGFAILGTSMVSAVLLDTGVALESVAQAVTAQVRIVSIVSFEVAFLSFFVVLMTAIIVGQSPQPCPDGKVASWWQKLTQGFHAGQDQVRQQ